MSVKLDTAKLDRLIADAPGEFSMIVRESAFAISGDAARRAPYDTGALSTGIHATEMGLALWRVQDSVEYGIFQELGFVHRHGGQFIQNPFMIPAVEAERPHFYRNIREFFRR